VASAAGVGVRTLNPKTDKIRSPCISQRLDVVQKSVVGGPQAVNIGEYAGRFDIVDFLSVDEAETLDDAAVGISLVRLSYAKLYQLLHRDHAAHTLPSGRSIQNHDVDCG